MYREVRAARADERAHRGPVPVERLRLGREMAVGDDGDPHDESLLPAGRAARDAFVTITGPAGCDTAAPHREGRCEPVIQGSPRSLPCPSAPPWPRRRSGYAAAEMGTARGRIRRRQLMAIVLVACAIAPVFNVLTSRASLAEAVQGLLDAVLVSTLVGGYFLFVRDGWARSWFQRLAFRTDLLLSSSVGLGLFLVGRAVGQVATTHDSRRFLASFTDAHLLYALPFFAILAVTVQFILQMNRMIGANILGYFVAGVYHRPKAEERIFLFVDLTGSTQLAERLGSARYFELLRRFVDDLTEPVLETGGEIYQYAGDEVVITWPMETGLQGGNCIRCFFEIGAAIRRNLAPYERDFGMAPAFRGGLHG